MRRNMIVGLTALAILLLAGAPAGAVPRTWQPTTGTNDWFNPANWDGGLTCPGAGDNVTMAAAGVALLTNSTPYLGSLTLSKTIVFSNWNTTLSATNVTIQSGGSMTLPAAFTAAQMSNNVYVICTNLTIDAGGKINANGMGYAGASIINTRGIGPGGGSGGQYGGGGGHGGWAYKFNVGEGLFYGSITAPVEPGSGGGTGGGIPGGAGGGAIRIAATTILNNGSITADGMDNGSVSAGAGSGGSIYIECRTLNGTGGVFRAVGGSAFHSYGFPGPGAGGRIAILYDTNAQRALAGTPALQFSVRPGTPPTGNEWIAADIGTLYFSDGYFLADTITNISGQVWGVSAWSPGSLTVSNSWIRFAEENFQLTVTNDLAVLGSSTRLELGGGMIVTNFPGNFPISATSGPSVVVGGNLIVSNGAALYVYAGATNSSTNYGASVTVAKDLTVATNSMIYSGSHAINGGSVRFRARNLTVAPGGWINADSGGYAAYCVAFGGTVNDGFGPGGGHGYPGGGGGYGGAGGASSGAGGGTYGSSNAPIKPGSGGGGGSSNGSASYGRGGGLVWIEATGQVNVQNKITANGTYGSSLSGGGSGGGIYITCKNFIGSANGVIQANGGGAPTSWPGGGGGGGGRVAIWLVRNLSDGVIPVSVGGGTGTGGAIGETGTIVWGQLPIPGTIFYGR